MYPFVNTLLTKLTSRRFPNAAGENWGYRGTGLYDIEGLTDVEEVEIDTPFD